MSVEIEGNAKVGDLMVKDLKNIIKEITIETTTQIWEKLQRLSEEVAKISKDNVDLKEELKFQREEGEQLRREVRQLEDQIKRKNIVVKGLQSSDSPKEVFKNLCATTLNLSDQEINIRAVKKIFDNKNKMSIIAELNSEEEVREILKNSRKLAGTRISMEKDLNSQKQCQKKIMLQLKKDVLAVDNSKRITVRDERMRVADKWLFWDRKNEFTSGNSSGEAVMDQIYGKKINISFKYCDILEKMVRLNVNN
jgi:hypothetical protein